MPSYTGYEEHHSAIMSDLKRRDKYETYEDQREEDLKMEKDQDPNNEEFKKQKELKSQ